MTFVAFVHITGLGLQFDLFQGVDAGGRLDDSFSESDR